MTKRENLKDRLLNSAEARIARDGWTTLRARDVTQDAGCALGSLYTAFDDLDMLILKVNGRTLARLGEDLRSATAKHAEPGDKLVALAEAYLAFALENLKLWNSVFEHRMPADWEVPDWHMEEHEVLIEHICSPLAALAPDLDGAALSLRARTLFSAVHGVVKLSLEDRFVAVRPEALAEEVRTLVRLIIAGMQPPGSAPAIR